MSIKIGTSSGENLRMFLFAFSRVKKRCWNGNIKGSKGIRINLSSPISEKFQKDIDF